MNSKLAQNEMFIGHWFRCYLLLPTMPCRVRKTRKNYTKNLGALVAKQIEQLKSRMLSCYSPPTSGILFWSGTIRFKTLLSGLHILYQYIFLFSIVCLPAYLLLCKYVGVFLQFLLPTVYQLFVQQQRQHAISALFCIAA